MFYIAIIFIILLKFRFNLMCLLFVIDNEIFQEAAAVGPASRPCTVHQDGSEDLQVGGPRGPTCLPSC